MDHQEINELVAETVMGWHNSGGTWLDSDQHPMDFVQCYQPTKNITHTWEVVEEITKMGITTELRIKHGYLAPYECMMHKDGTIVSIESETIGMAVCIAALSMLGVQVND